MCRHTRVVVWLLRAAVLLGVLQGAAVLARGSPRGLLQEPTSATQAGCDCPSSWNYTFDANRTVELSGCSNPDNDPQGTWCPIDPNTCRSFTGVSENGGKAYAYDYCPQVREKTKSGCLCRPYWFGFRAFEDVGTKEYEGVCASPDGAAKPYCFVDPATCRGAIPNNEKSTCDRPKVPIDGAVGRKETASGCKCIKFKLATGAQGPFKVIDSCSNPDNDPKGSWCVVNRTSCPTFYSSFTQDFRSVFYDYCTPVRATTNAGCLCRTVWGPGTKYRDQCANPDGKPASWCTVMPGTCVGQPAGAYDSPVWDFCEKVSGQDPDTLATGLDVEGVDTGDVAIGDNGVTASPLPLGTNSSSTAGSAPAKKKRSFVDRNLGWIIGTIVGAILLIFFIFTVRYLFCTKPQEEQMHTKGLLVPSSPSSKGSAAPSSPSGSIPSNSPDGTYTDAVITATPKYSSKNGLSFAEGDKNGKADIGHDAKIITVSSIDDELLEEEKKMSKKGDNAFDMLVKRAAEIRAKKKDDGSLARQEKRGKKVSDGERKMRKGGKAVVVAGDTEEALEGVGGSDESPTGTKLEGNNYATKSYNKARSGGKPSGAAPAGKAPLDWQIGMTPKRSAKLEPAETATDLRSSVAGVLHRLTGIGKKSEDNSSPTTPSPTATRPVQEPWEVYARGGTNTNTSTNNTSLQTRWSAVPSSEKDLLTDAPLSTEPAADVTPGQSVDVTTSQVSSRSSMLQSLLWLPKGKSWGMDFLQWRVPEAMNKNGSGDNVLKLGTIQSQDAMRVSTLPSAKPNRISVSLDDMNDSPAGTPAGIPPKSGSGFAKLRGSSGSSEGGSARSVLDPARRRLLGLGAPVSPAAGAAMEDTVPGKDKERTADEAAPLAKSTTSFWNLWGGATGDKPATGAEATQDVVPKAGLQMAGLYPDTACVRPAEGSFDGALPLRKSDVQGVVKQALRASQLERSNSSGSSAATHYELRKSLGVESPVVEVAPAQVQWPAPGLQGADAAHEKRVDSQLLAKLLESESSSAATPVTIGHMVASPSSSREGLSPGALAAARTAAASPKFPFSVPTANMWRATPASKPAPAPVTSLKPSSMPALTANHPSSLSPSQLPVSIHSGPQISSPAAKTTASPLPALAALPAASALNPSSGSNPTTPKRPSPQLGRTDWSASWAAASLNSRVGPPAPGAPSSPATSLSISMGNNSFKERILAEASSPRSPSMRDISAVKALMASTASSTGSLGFSPLRERIMAAAAVEPGAAGEQPTSIYARNTSQSKAASTAGQSSWSRVKSTGAPAVASARPQAAPQEPNAAIITVGDNVPE